MIPKIIHYCWFGRNPKPELAQICMKSWKKYCHDYEIIEWNEDNYDLSKAPLYVQQAYEAKKWAFVTDYVRLQLVYENGGIYVDTDVEFRKSPSYLLSNHAFFGFESPQYVATGVGFGAVKGCSIIKEMMKVYDSIPFLLKDGTYDLTPCPVRNTEVLLRHGLKLDGTLQILEEKVLILPQEYLSPMETGGEKINYTKNTISVHWYAGSWLLEVDRAGYYRWMKWKKILVFLSKTGKIMLGNRFYPLIRDNLKRIVQSHGKGKKKNE